MTHKQRKARFKAALALAGKTAAAWCAEQDVTEHHLYMVLRGDRESRRLTDAVDALIAERLGKTRVA